MFWLKSLVVLLLATAAYAQTTERLYDEHGATRGHIEITNDTVKVYDKNGSLTETYKHQGNTIQFYDRNGKTTGSMRVAPTPKLGQ